MKYFVLILSIMAVSACKRSPTATNTPSPTPRVEPAETSMPAKAAVDIPPQASWQIQYTGDMDYSLDVDVFNLDLFDTDAETISQLHERDIFIMCYFSAGSYENWRPDIS